MTGEKDVKRSALPKANAGSKMCFYDTQGFRFSINDDIYGGKLFSNSESIQKRAEAAVLFKKLEYPVLLHCICLMLTALFRTSAIEDSSIDFGDFFKGPLPGKFLKLLDQNSLLSTLDSFSGLINAQIVFQLLAQFIRFPRRTEGVEAARKYFLDARKSPRCTYHVYVAYATMAFCLDKDPKMAHNIFEAGLKRFMHEPVYILEYADFLTCLNDDQNVSELQWGIQP
ncbi:Cleavage stimulation factor subunit [Arachis hypogaea]|nr:Cleavage stimulation factor subunit [Arachis hypogaea]